MYCVSIWKKKKKKNKKVFGDYYSIDFLAGKKKKSS